MLSKEEEKKISNEIIEESSIKYNNFSNDKIIDPSSQVYIFCKLKSEINAQNENGWTPIYRAIIANNLEALYELLKIGANPDIPNNLGETPLYLSVDINNYDALIILLQYKADCNLAKKNGNTPLHIATKRNKNSFMSALLRNNANPNIVNKLYSQTATHLAIINKVDECTLVEFNVCKADIYNIKDKYDKTPFDYAKDVGDQNYINLLIKIFGKDPNNNGYKENRITWGGFTPNEIEDNAETTPVKINYADGNNSNFISLSKNVFISFDENDLNKNNGTVIIKNINDENKNIICQTTSNQSESQNNDKNNNYENNKENVDINTSIKKSRNLLNNNQSKINIDISNTEPIKSKNSSLGNINQNSNTSQIKEGIKNNLSDTVKKLNISNNSEITSNFHYSTPIENNYSISYNNSKINQNNENSRINSNIFNMENRMSSIISNNSKRNNNSIPSSHSQTRKDISEMNPLEMINQVITTSNNSNVFSELQINSMINKNTQSDEDINNKTVQENALNNNNNLLNDSLEYSKSNAHIVMEQSNNNNNQNEENNIINNKNDYIDVDNINKLNITINEYEDINKNNENIKTNNQHRQLSYHNKQPSNTNNKENVMINCNNISKRNSNTSTNNYSLNNSKKMTVRNSTVQNELLTTVPNSIIQGDNNANVITKQKYYRNNQTQPEYQKEKTSKNLIIEENQNNLQNFNTYNTYKPIQNLKNSRIRNNKSTLSGAPTSNNFIYSFSNNSYSNNNNKTNKFPSLKLSEIENINYNNNSFLSKNINNKSEELNLCSPQNIPNELLTRLREWLISCDLLCYYNLLIKNDIYDIDLYIHNLKNNKINISYKDIEDIGIKKPGHIFRFLLKLQIDTGILDSQIYNTLTNKFNSNVLTTIGLTASTNIIKCCGITLFKQSGGVEKPTCNNNICCDTSTSSFNNNYYYNDIFGFLKYKDLLDYKENFIHNGFDQIDYIFIQLFSNFKFNKEILNDYMHIYSENDKKKVLQKLYEEKKRLALELGLNYDMYEEAKILNSQIDINNNTNDNENSCFIF